MIQAIAQIKEIVNPFDLHITRAIACNNECVVTINEVSKICEGIACSREANASQLLRCVYIP